MNTVLRNRNRREKARAAGTGPRCRCCAAPRGGSSQQLNSSPIELAAYRLVITPARTVNGELSYMSVQGQGQPAPCQRRHHGAGRRLGLGAELAAAPEEHQRDAHQQAPRRQTTSALEAGADKALAGQESDDLPPAGWTSQRRSGHACAAMPVEWASRRSERTRFPPRRPARPDGAGRAQSSVRS